MSAEKLITQSAMDGVNVPALVSNGAGAIVDHIDIWTSAVQAKSSSGRGSGKKRELYGIKKLRELILELAVRGKLVPQDPSDEPASVLLERIAAEKARLVQEKKIKKPKAQPAIGVDEVPSDLPAGWAVARLGDVMNVLNGRAYKKHEMLQEGTPLLRVGNLFTSNEWYYSDMELEPEKYINTGDLIYAWSASFGPFIWEGGKVIYHYHIWKLDLYHEPSVSKQYLYSYLLAITESIKAAGHGVAMVHMTKDKMEKLVLPIPPLDEQHRIAAKIDELMALCDQLEQQTEASLDAHQVLVETLLNSLLLPAAAAEGSSTNNQDAAEFSKNWARISEHFDTLFTTEQSIDALKQTILQLAVMGKLVPQDPNDEPAAKLLERIAEEKSQLVKEKKIKKQKALPPIADDEKPFELPKGWEWCRLNDLSLSSEAGWSPQCDPTPRDGDNWGVLKVSAVTWGQYKPEENKRLPSALEPRSECEVMPGDFLISRANTADLVARAVVVPTGAPRKLMMSDKIIRFKFANAVSPYYVNLANNSTFSRQYYADVAGGTSSSMKNVSRVQIQNLVLAIPPYEEELRILNKVDHLMALCDQLKQRLRDSQQTQLRLTDAIVEQAL